MQSSDYSRDIRTSQNPTSPMSAPSQAPGGFLHPDSTLLSPPSTAGVSSPAASSAVGNVSLPRARLHPLKPGSSKETAFINYVDRGMLEVSRRYAKKFTGKHEEEEIDGGADGAGDRMRGGEVKGYESFKEAGKDIEKLVDVVWVSGTPALQTSYLLSLALLVATYLPSFPPAPRTTFNLLHKLDLAFASLLQGRDLSTGEVLPGFETSSRALSTTEKVRIKSLVERTRVVVVESMRRGEYEEEEEEEEDDTNDESNGNDEDDTDMDFGDEADRWEMEIARVYDRTIVELGESLGNDPAGPN
ncbi:hypothetical protein L228DRAFT_245169 [Xylona heveae TC161]|uniref:Uncharacterized protein n=1 Tax=Xylona heveae (strain CBS 132557 / TC161) TaxID=1328760 RepID=A0A165I2A0_XYLHT|nr:hypothetical protein L228DRAFT_245169 [Xylona heveae TC161]KZF24262.1 hypothetical protein L228DRAFT_245169 [Xylona heveae TC161]